MYVSKNSRYRPRAGASSRNVTQDVAGRGELTRAESSQESGSGKPDLLKSP